MDFYGNPEFFAQAKHSEEVTQNIRKKLFEILPDLYNKLTPYELDVLRNLFGNFGDRTHDYFCKTYNHDCLECQVSNLCNLLQLIDYLLA